MSDPSEQRPDVVVYSDAVPEEPLGEEVEDRRQQRFFLEKEIHAVLGEDGLPRPVVEDEPTSWMIMGTVYDDPERADATWKFHKEKHPGGGDRFILAETRFYVLDCNK